MTRAVHVWILLFAMVVPADAVAADKPHIEPIERTPYSRDDDAPPTPLGFIIGTSALFVVLGGVGLGIRRRRRREDRARWIAAHPGALHDDEIDPWLARAAVEQATGLARESDDARRIRVGFVTQVDDRLIVHVEGAVRRSGDHLLSRLFPPPRSRRFAEFWTLAPAGDAWTLVNMEPDRTAPRSKAARAAAPWAASAKG